MTSRSTYSSRALAIAVLVGIPILLFLGAIYNILPPRGWAIGIVTHTETFRRVGQPFGLALLLGFTGAPPFAVFANGGGFGFSFSVLHSAECSGPTGTSRRAWHALRQSHRAHARIPPLTAFPSLKKLSQESL